MIYICRIPGINGLSRGTHHLSSILFQSEIDLVKKEITRAEESISRNEKSNTVVANMARQKLSDLHKRLHRLHDQESKLTSHREKQNSVDKKRIF